MSSCLCDEVSMFFFFKDTATTEFYPLSLHDALPISTTESRQSNASALVLTAAEPPVDACATRVPARRSSRSDRKSTRLNSSHANISYAVFCLKKKKIKDVRTLRSKLCS